MQKLSVYLCFLLRHHPEAVGLEMDIHGWVEVARLIEKVNAAGKYTLTPALLRALVAEDEKGRYRFSPDGARIKACQGHSIPWVIPELDFSAQPPRLLYHGTTKAAWKKIQASGEISRMKRHSVHLHADIRKGWDSALRRNQPGIVLVVDTERLAAEGVSLGVSENGVWCAGAVPLCCVLRAEEEASPNHPLPASE